MAVTRVMLVDDDSVVLHGATPAELRPVVEAWAAVRPDGLDALPANPGGVS